jgi:hypothetical protein
MTDIQVMVRTFSLGHPDIENLDPITNLQLGRKISIFSILFIYYFSENSKI